MQDIYVNISVSTQCFKKKPTNNEIFQTFKNDDYSITEFIDFVQNGRTVCHNFGKSEFTLEDKKESNFVSAQFVALDIDNASMQLCELMDIIPDADKPTFAYTTFSNTVENPRYRLVYCFKNTIDNIKIYNSVYTYFLTKYEKISGISNKDNCCKSVSQMIFGTNANTQILYEYGNIFDATECYCSIEQKCKHKCINKKEEKTLYSCDCTFDENILCDYHKMTMKDFIFKYADMFPLVEHTLLPEVDKDIMYILLPPNYTELKRYYIKSFYEDDKGIRNMKMKVRKTRDGEGRRKKLFLAGVMRRYMNPNITPDQLLYNLTYDLVNFMYNFDDKITKKQLISITKNAMGADISKYEGIIKKTDKTFILNPNFSNPEGLSKKQMVQIARKKINYSKIGELFDASLTDQENLDKMAKYGLIISLRTLKNFRKDNNITKNKKSNRNQRFNERKGC